MEHKALHEILHFQYGAYFIYLSTAQTKTSMPGLELGEQLASYPAFVIRSSPAVTHYFHSRLIPSLLPFTLKDRLSLSFYFEHGSSCFNSKPLSQKPDKVGDILILQVSRPRLRKIMSSFKMIHSWTGEWWAQGGGPHCSHWAAKWLATYRRQEIQR